MAYAKQMADMPVPNLDTVPDIRVHAIKVLEAGVQTSCPFQYNYGTGDRLVGSNIFK